MKSITALALCFFLLTGPAHSQVFAENIHSVKLYVQGDQTSFPMIALGKTDGMELHFDDFDNRVKNYYYTFQLCNADWTPGVLHPFEYIKGFQNIRITNYRNSSISSFRYIHYQAPVPDRNCYPSRSGNYLLKVFLDNDTTKLVFARRMVVVDIKTTIASQVQQPFNATLYRTGQKLSVVVQTDNKIQVMSPNDLKLVILQNNNWKTATLIDRPTIYRGNYYEYSDESVTAFPAGKEFRWLDLRSLRLLSDRMQDMDTKHDTTDVTVKPETMRTSQVYVYYRDLAGSYTIETMENINPYWQGDYAKVHFSFFPPGNREFAGNDLYIFGEMTNYAADSSGKMIFNREKGAYEKTLILKQGYYNYVYATLPKNGNGFPDLSATEGNYFGTENSYVVLVYYRPFGARVDEVVGYAQLNSIFR